MMEKIQKKLESGVAAVAAGGGFVDIDWLSRSRGAAIAVLNRSGGTNIEAIAGNRRRLLLHSSYDPVKEAVRAAGPSELWSGRHAVVYGLGCGYHIELLAELTGRGGAVTVLECNPDVARAALESAPISSIAAIPGVRILIGPHPAIARAALARVRDLEAGRSEIAARVFAHPPSLELIPFAERPVRAALKLIHGGCFLDGAAADPRVTSEFDSLHKRLLSGADLSDTELALLFIEALDSESRYHFPDSLYEQSQAPAQASRILAISLSLIGDVLTATPALRALRDSYPEAHIVFLTETPTGVLMENGDTPDRVIQYPRHAFIDEFRAGPTLKNLDIARGRFVELIGELRAEEFDAVFNLHVSSRSAILAGAAGTPHAHRSGFIIDHDRLPVVRGNAWARARLLDSMPAALPHEENNLRAAGLTPRTRATLINLPDNMKFDSVTKNASAAVVGVNPFCSVPARTWDFDRFSTICRLLTRDMGLNVMVFAGVSNHERELAGALCAELGDQAIPCIGAPLDEAALAMRRCSLFITGDTGPMHIAGAAGVRCLVISGPTINLPYGGAGHIAVAADMPCLGCGPFTECSHRKCLLVIEPAHVARIASAMLENTPDTAARILARDTLSPHSLFTTGCFDSISPRFLIRLRGPDPHEKNIAAELTRIAVFNAMQLIDSGALESADSRPPIDDPGLAGLISPETAVSDVLRRHDFITPDHIAIVKLLEDARALLSRPPDPDEPFGSDRLSAPFFMLRRFLTAADMKKLIPAAMRACCGFIYDTIRLLR